jgi:hypothetical protein
VVKLKFKAALDVLGASSAELRTAIQERALPWPDNTHPIVEGRERSRRRYTVGQCFAWFLRSEICHLTGMPKKTAAEIVRDWVWKWEPFERLCSRGKTDQPFLVWCRAPVLDELATKYSHRWALGGPFMVDPIILDALISRYPHLVVLNLNVTFNAFEDHCQRWGWIVSNGEFIPMDQPVDEAVDESPRRKAI